MGWKDQHLVLAAANQAGKPKLQYKVKIPIFQPRTCQERENRFKSLGGKKKCCGRRQAGRLLPSWRTANARAGENPNSPHLPLIVLPRRGPSAAPPHPRRRPDPLAPAPTMEPPFRVGDKESRVEKPFSTILPQIAIVGLSNQISQSSFIKGPQLRGTSPIFLTPPLPGRSGVMR